LKSWQTQLQQPLIHVWQEHRGFRAAEIRKLRVPDPYKAKGIKYSDEVIRRKVGKAGGK